jgi:hypothetical protein
LVRGSPRARAVAAELSTRVGKTIQGSDNRSAARASEIVFLTVPYAVQRSTGEAVVAALRGKNPGRYDRAARSPPKSAWYSCRKANRLWQRSSNSPEARCASSRRFRTYPRNISMSSIIANSAAAEALTSVLITINRRYKIAGAGIRITGVPKA